MRQLVVGNWKMNGTLAAAYDRACAVVAESGRVAHVDFVVCPPFVHLLTVGKALVDSPVKLGAQNCHTADKGAFTGEISVPMLAEIGCAYVLVGHSERRHGMMETSAMVKTKAEAACAAGLRPIICVGETESERDAGMAEMVIKRQLRESLPEASGPFLVAYEPVWAIGTGKVATAAEIAFVHGVIRTALAQDKTPILYGGSVNPANAAEILAIENVNGVLVGGASLDFQAFLAIGAAAP